MLADHRATVSDIAPHRMKGTSRSLSSSVQPATPQVASLSRAPGSTGAGGLFPHLHMTSPRAGWRWHVAQECHTLACGANLSSHKAGTSDPRCHTDANIRDRANKETSSLVRSVFKEMPNFNWEMSHVCLCAGGVGLRGGGHSMRDLIPSLRSRTRALCTHREGSP